MVDIINGCIQLLFTIGHSVLYVWLTFYQLWGENGMKVWDTKENLKLGYYKNVMHLKKTKKNAQDTWLGY